MQEIRGVPAAYSTPLIWIALLALSFQAILLWMRLINLTLAEGIISTNALLWNVIRFLDLVILSALIALGTKYYKKLHRAKLKRESLTL